jgi:phosphate acetyltransferase
MASHATASASAGPTVGRLRAGIEPPGPRLLFPEGDDSRVVEAAGRLAADGLARPTVITDQGSVGAAPPGVHLLCAADARTPELIDSFARQQQLSSSIAVRQLAQPELLGAALVRAGEAEAMVVGARTTTHDVAMACHRVFGLAQGVRHASGFFLVETTDGRAFLFADCALQPEPDPEALADIAVMTAHTAAQVFGWEPRVAMLSFSTHHSAHHPAVEKVREATERVRRLDPPLLVDGELQADVAVDPLVAAEKLAADGPVAGDANVLIFPSLEAGNIAYKLLRGLGHARAVGVILQGYGRPAADVSRGAHVDELADAGVILAAVAREMTDERAPALDA